MAGKAGGIEFLFRFRDLVAPTVEEHRAIIQKYGTCWWGWWKRPAENGRYDVWKNLSSAISARGPQKVGLFDSGSGEVRMATVEQVIAPDRSESAFPRIPDDERKLIPSYYRKSPFSRAWMKRSAIGDPIEFFGNHSYAEAPSRLGLWRAAAFQLSRSLMPERSTASIGSRS